MDEYREICTKYGDEVDHLYLFNVLFLLYEYNRNFEKAKETLHKTITLGKKLNKFNIISNAYSNFSHILIEEKEYEKALEMGKVGLEMAALHKPASEMLAIRVQLNIALAYIHLGHLQSSEYIITNIIHNPILNEFIREKTECFMLKGEWYTSQNLYKEAFQSFTTAKELVESYQDVYLLKTIQEKRCELCERMSDFSLGYSVQKEYIRLLNTIRKQEIELLAIKLDVKYNLTAIEKKANTDYLTGIYNRNYLECTTNDWLQEASLKNEYIICLLLDIDNFKYINDQYGHLFGDEVIIQVSKSCSRIVGENEMIGRYGGDEFVVILRQTSRVDGEKKAKQIAEELRNLIINKDGASTMITVSIGIADNSNDAISNFAELFHQADMNLYKAKANGKDQIHFDK